MKYLLPCIFMVNILLSACSDSPGSQATSEVKINTDSIRKQHFFPVTSYIKGQIFEVKNKGVNPLRYTTIKDHTDSAWMKLDDFEQAVSEFLSPVIDSNNLVMLFSEKNFLDQTIASYTFTYEPIGSLPDTMRLLRWDVYIDPETNKVSRVYLVKKTGDSQILQLTWQGDKYCKLVTIRTDASGNSFIEKEEKITWDL